MLDGEVIICAQVLEAQADVLALVDSFQHEKEHFARLQPDHGEKRPPLTHFLSQFTRVNR